MKKLSAIFLLVAFVHIEASAQNTLDRNADVNEKIVIVIVDSTLSDITKITSRISLTLDFLRGYEGEKFEENRWKLKILNDRVVAKRKWGLTRISLFENYFDRVTKI